MGLEMATRRKHNIARQPNGQPRREREFAPTQIKRLRDAAMAGLRDPEWGTELGRLLLNRVIDEEMYAAGKRWAEMSARYWGIVGAFPVKSAKAEGGSWSHQPDPDSPKGKEISIQERGAMERYFEADAVLVTAAIHSPGVGAAVRRVCEDGQVLGGYSEVLALRIGLLKLADHWGLTGPNKSSTRNAR